MTESKKNNSKSLGTIRYEGTEDIIIYSGGGGGGRRKESFDGKERKKEKKLEWAPDVLYYVWLQVR